MSPKPEPQKAMHQRPNDEKPSMSRRKFLKGSIIGAGTLVALPACNSLQTVAAPTPQQGGSVPSGTPQQQQPSIGPDAPEFWPEPNEWIVSNYPDEFLQLHVTEHKASTIVTGVTGEQPAFLFSWNGLIPGPTIRMRGDEDLQLRLFNDLSGNTGFDGGQNNPIRVPQKLPDWQLNSSVVGPFPEINGTIYGPHQQHTTNIHTHGLHVNACDNPDGSKSDDIFLRIIPIDDYNLRKQSKLNWPLIDDGVVQELRGIAEYEFRLGKSGGVAETHPPGTHWYHPHAHGSTYDQVASGMAGFLIVEGDVDDRLKEQIHGYKERLILFQRVINPAQPAEREGKTKTRNGPWETVNGWKAGRFVAVMQPGSIERWRLLNGSVDGQGYIEFTVLEGEDADSDAALELDQLAFDGVTLVTEDGKYTTRSGVKSLVMAPANRADFLVQAPSLEDGQPKIYTIWAKWVPDATDQPNIPDKNQDIKIATLIIRGEEVDPGVSRDPTTGQLELEFPDVPNYLLPIPDEEITNDDSRWRTRQVIYSGWGGASYPCPRPTIPAVTQPPFDVNNAMMIDGEKFDPMKSVHKMGLNTAEEWTLWNYSMTIYEDSSGTTHYGETVSPTVLAAAQKNKKLFSKAADHPFHMHQNPFWVLSIVDANGKELLPDGHPRWQDVVRIPRNGGRVVFRSRFWDFACAYVNHCHLLEHEDWGMMQCVEVMTNEADANYVPNPPGFEWPAPTKQEMYDRNLGPDNYKNAFCGKNSPNPCPPPDDA
jgi:FtsP/CotA-like multicopper oxidase with cupredoxin domain